MTKNYEVAAGDKGSAFLFLTAIAATCFVVIFSINSSRRTSLLRDRKNAQPFYSRIHRRNNDVSTSGIDSEEFNNHRVLLDDDSLQQISRAYSPWTGTKDGWCTHRHDYDTSHPTGLFYVKVPKTASSTCASVELQISHRHGKERFGTDNSVEECMRFYHHNPAWTHNFTHRDPEKSILWTTIREPTKRAISHIFFADVSRGRQMKPTDENILAELRKKSDDYQLNYIRTFDLPWKEDDELTREDKALAAEDVVQKLLEQYNFIALTERLDESFVAMKMLFNWDDGDILYLSEKISGGWTWGNGGKGCVKIVKSFISKKVQRYLESDEWQRKNAADYVLYEAANRSLDLTIDSLGRDTFEKELAKHRLLLQQVEDVCREVTDFRCTKDGVYQREKADRSCYNTDIGCGYECINEFDRLHIKGSMPFEDVKKVLWEQFGRSAEDNESGEEENFS